MTKMCEISAYKDDAIAEGWLIYETHLAVEILR